jgi:hypothetical protein
MRRICRAASAIWPVWSPGASGWRSCWSGWRLSPRTRFPAPTDRAGSRVEALAASDPFVAVIDDLQYTVLNEGPCITAALEARTVRSGSLGGEDVTAL